jgi:hypothetical protein
VAAWETGATPDTRVTHFGALGGHVHGGGVGGGRGLEGRGQAGMLLMGRQAHAASVLMLCWILRQRRLATWLATCQICRFQCPCAAGEQALPQYPVRYNVRDYGARGDGNTDDSGAFQRALDAAAAEAARTGSGVAVLIPDGTYAIRKTVQITASNVVLRGTGVRLDREGQGGALDWAQHREALFAATGSFTGCQALPEPEAPTKLMLIPAAGPMHSVHARTAAIRVRQRPDLGLCWRVPKVGCKQALLAGAWLQRPIATTCSSSSAHLLQGDCGRCKGAVSTHCAPPPPPPPSSSPPQHHRQAYGQQGRHHAADRRDAGRKPRGHPLAGGKAEWIRGGGGGGGGAAADGESTKAVLPMHSQRGCCMLLHTRDLGGV